jgi:hypothetical protein
MSRRREVIENPDEFGKKGLTYLKTLSDNVLKKIEKLGKLIENYELLHGKYKDLVEHLYNENQVELCEHHAKFWFVSLMLLHDISQVVQNGKLFTKYLVESIDETVDEISDKRADFTWLEATDCPLNNVSVQGLTYRCAHYRKKMEDHDVSCISKLFPISFLIIHCFRMTSLLKYVGQLGLLHV